VVPTDAKLAHYPELPRTVAGLQQLFGDADHIGSDGFFQRVEGAVRFVKGKHRGSPLAAVAASSPAYLEWMLGQDFFDDTKAAVRDALASARAGRVSGGPVPSMR
jgi:hypothetical protein